MFRSCTSSRSRALLAALWLGAGALAAAGCGGPEDAAGEAEEAANSEGGSWTPEELAEGERAIAEAAAEDAAQEAAATSTGPVAAERSAEAVAATPPPAPPAPGGSWSATCPTVTTQQADTFCARCLDRRGVLASSPSCISNQACPNWNAWNDGGVLRCSALRIQTAAQLVAALRTARPRSTIYVSDGATLDLTRTPTLRVPAGVTLASGRGRGRGGARLLTRSTGASPLIQAAGHHVRITGLNLEGADSTLRGTSASANQDGIKAEGVSGLLVDQCDLKGWPHAAVFLSSATGIVRMNDIHDARQERRGQGGYGVCLDKDGSSALVERNHFTRVVHGVAGGRYVRISYTARNNTFEGNFWQALDMHGVDEAKRGRPPQPWAGDSIVIRNNTFRERNQPAVMIRGKPRTGAVIEGNCFPHPTEKAAVKQRLWLEFIPEDQAYQNIAVGSNEVGQPAGTCHLVDLPP